MELDGGDDLGWPEIQAYIDAAEVRDNATCPECGQSTDAALEASVECIVAGFALAARALLVQYDLTEDALASLLEFDGGQLPGWTVELLAWSSGGRHGDDVTSED